VAKPVFGTVKTVALFEVMVIVLFEIALEGSCTVAIINELVYPINEVVESENPLKTKGLIVSEDVEILVPSVTVMFEITVVDVEATPTLIVLLFVLKSKKT
jgi:hypothetical protein